MCKTCKAYLYYQHHWPSSSETLEKTLELFLELDTDAHASIQQNDDLFNPVLHNMAASSEMLGLVTLTELLNEEGDFIQKHVAKFVVTACALQIYKCKLK